VPGRRGGHVAVGRARLARARTAALGEDRDGCRRDRGRPGGRGAGRRAIPRPPARVRRACSRSRRTASSTGRWGSSTASQTIR
jgi:hypothetical protein